MSSENDLMTKLLISKQIMEKHDTINRGGVQSNLGQYQNNAPMVEDFKPVAASYNIPDGLLSEEAVSIPVSRPNVPVTEDRILNSRLPDEIKKLMIENPIVQPSQTTNVGISDELVDKAARLMNANANGQVVNEIVKKQPVRNNTIDNSDIKSIIKETVEGVLKENGLLVESTKKSKETFRFRVGQHIFEGVVTKVSKVK